MLDVLHYLLEDAFDVSTAEQAQSRDQMRTALYKDFYNRPYKYASKKKNEGFNTAGSMGDFDFPEENSDAKDDDSDVKPFNPRHKEPTKPYTPPTEVGSNMDDPFSGLLDAPIG